MLSLRRLAQSGGLVAAAFALGYPLIAVPNVEPLTLAFFAIGCAYGPLWGLWIGLAGEGIFATFHPLGVPIAPVLIAQMLGMGLAGAVGGWSRPLWDSQLSTRAMSLRAVVLGVLVTLIFDLLSNLAFALTIGPFIAVMIAGLPFAAVHVVSNALLFGFFFPILQRWLLRPTTNVMRSNP